MKGPLCGGCYSKLIAEFYPGKHVRMEPQGGGNGGGGGARPAGGWHGDKPDITRPASAPSREDRGGGSASGGPGDGGEGAGGGNASGGPGDGSGRSSPPPQP